MTMIQQLSNQPRIRTQLLNESNKAGEPDRISRLNLKQVASSVVVDSNQWMIPRMI